MKVVKRIKGGTGFEYFLTELIDKGAQAEVWKAFRIMEENVLAEFAIKCFNKSSVLMNAKSA